MRVRLSAPLWAALVFMGLGCLLQVIGFSVPYWNQFAAQHMGLWQRCAGNAGCTSVSGRDLADTMEIGRALQALGLISYIVLIVLIVLYLCWRPDLRLLTAAVIIAFLCLFSILVGAILWASASNTTISWAYYLCFLSGLSAAAAGGILIHVRRQDFLAGVGKSVTEMQHI